MDSARRDMLERRYDGPIPPADPAAPPLAPAARARLFHRLAAETRALAASHRRRLPALPATADAHLDRLQRDLRLYRAQGIAWRGG